MSKTTGLVFEGERSIDVEPDATVLYDRSRYGHNGTFKSANRPDWIQLPSGLWVLNFLAQDYIDLRVGGSTSPSLDFTAGQAWSVVGWFYHKASPSQVHNFFMGKESYYGITFRFSSTNTYQFREEDGDYHTLLSNASAYDEVWTHLGWISNGTTISLYINGAYRNAVTPTTTTLEIWLYGATEVTLGTYSYEGAVLADVYNYAFSAGKIKQRYEAERHFFGV